MLRRYEHIVEIPPSADGWDIKVRGAQSLSTELANRRDEARLYRRLAVLRLDTPIAESAADLEWRGADRDALERLCARIDYERFLDRVTRWR